MSYKLEVSEAVPEGIRRVAYEQIDQALASLRDQPEGRNEAVHDARKRFKKLRAVLRLVRDEMGEDVYKSENICYRDAGRRLADVRDSFVLIETLDDLKTHYDDQLYASAFAGARRILIQDHEAVVQRVLDEHHAVEEVIATLEEARTRVADWPVEQDGFAALAGGLHRVYRRGRNRFAEAYEDPTAERFHEWRKRVKYLWYHMRLLQLAWGDVLGELADALHDLSDLLGDEHDLAELQERLLDEPELFDSQSEQQALRGLAEQRRAVLQAEAHPLGHKIYAEEPDVFVDRMASYWHAWRHVALQAEVAT